MLTRCPACQTVFRVAPEQLAARHGRVRCGHCLNAFNALQNAVDGTQEATTVAEPALEGPHASQVDSTASEGIPVEAVSQGKPRSEAAAEDEAGEAASGESPPELPAVFRSRAQQALEPVGPEAEREAAEPSDDLADDVIAEGALQTASADEAQAAPTDAPLERAPGGEAREGSISTAVLTRSDPDDDRAEYYVRAAGIPVPPPSLSMRNAPEDRRRVLGIAVGCLVVTLLVQGLFLLRQPLTRTIPALRGPLLALCQALGCQLPLPREAAEISVEASDLHPEPGAQGDFVLHATLRNRAGYPQAYPHVELSLTDALDKTLVRRVFSPEEWIPGNPPDAAFAPDATAVVALSFNSAGVAAVGYRVYAFYP
jgi:predicted Zn finger-like uncharacterized protein